MQPNFRLRTLGTSPIFETPPAAVGPAPAVRDAVAALRCGGFSVCRIVPGQKKPAYRGWSTRSLEPHEFAPEDMVGVLGGSLSDAGRAGHALVILDIDDPAAVGLADSKLPPTAMVDGRAGKPRSHRYYLVPLGSVPR